MSAALADKRSRFPLPEASTEGLCSEDQVVPVKQEPSTQREPGLEPASPCDADATQQIRPGGAATPTGQGFKVVQHVAGYEILEELGRGGMGVVYKAWQQSLQRHVALKMILAGSFAGPQDLDRFRAEAMAIARLHHPNLLNIHEIGDSSNLPFYAMEYMEGGSLARRLNGQPIAPRIAAPLVRSLAQAMDYAHKNGIVHRDLKPANILLSGDADAPLEACVAKITDFGIAKLLHQDSSYTRTGDILGTPHYMAPEQAIGKSATVGPAADVYSLGAILYELLTGRPPFAGHNGADVLLMLAREEPERPTHWVRGIPRDLETICLKCLDKNPARRYATAGDLADDLLRFGQNEPIHARPASFLDRGIKWTRRRPATTAILVMSISLAVVGISMMAGIWRQQVDHAQKQEHLLLQTKILLADAFLERGIHLSEKGDVRRGMHWMVRALEVTEKIEDMQVQAHPLAPIIRMNLASWGQCVYPREMLLPHANWVWDVAFSPDNRFVATASRDETVQIWHARTSQPTGPPLVHPFPVWGIAFHPDGKTLFSICGDGLGHAGWLSVWSAHPDRPGQFVPRGEPMMFPHELFRLHLNTPGDRLWVCSARGGIGTLLAFDPQGPGNGIRLVGSPMPGHHPQAVFSPDGNTLATIVGMTRDGNVQATNDVQLWNARTGEAIGAPWTHPGLVRTLAFSKDNRQLIVGSAAGPIQDLGETSVLQIWDIAQGKIVTKSTPLQGRLKASAVAPNGQLLAVSLFEYNKSRDEYGRLKITEGHVALWNLSVDGRLESYGLPLRTQHVVWHIVFSPDSRMVLAGCENSGAFLWSVSNSQRLVPPIWHDGNCVKVAFSPDGRTAVTASAGGTLSASARLWEVPRFGHIGPTMLQADGIRNVHWENDGVHAWIATVHHNARWDPHRGIKTAEIRFPEYTNHVHPTRDDDRFLCQFNRGILKEYDRATGKFRSLPGMPAGPRDGHVYSHHRLTGRILDFQYRPCRMEFRDERGHSTTKCVEEPGYEYVASELNAQGDCLAVSQAMLTRSNRVVLYDAHDLSVKYVLPMKHSIHTLAFSPDGQTLAFGGMDRQIQRLDVKSGKLIGSPLLHEGVIQWAGYFFNDERFLVTASGKGTMLLWDITTGKRIGPAFEHEAELISIAIHPQGKYLLTGTHGTQARSWCFPRPVEGSLAQIRLWVETVTGMEMNDQDTIVPVEMERVMERRERLAQMGGSPVREW